MAAILLSAIFAAYLVAEEKPIRTYLYLDKDKRSHYLRTPETVFLDTNIWCVTNGEESIVCGVTHIQEIIE
jgi:hypothetical protein